VLSAAYAGFAGSLYAHYIAYVHPDAFTQAESIMALTIIAVGGMRSLPGIAVSGIALVVAMEYLRAFSEFRLIIYAVVLILSLLFMPDGMWRASQGSWRARGEKRENQDRCCRSEEGTCVEPILSVQGITMKFGGLVALKDVTFDVYKATCLQL